MARGRGRGVRGFKQKFNKRTSSKHDLINKRQYEEFGEAHPIEEKEVKIKRLKVEDTQDYPEVADNEEVDESTSDDEEVADDAMSKLLATFGTGNHSIESDEDEEHDSNEEVSGSDENDDSEGSGDDDDDDDNDDDDDDSDDDGIKENGENKEDEQENMVDSEEEHDEWVATIDSDVEDDDDDDDCPTNKQQDSFILHFERNLNEDGAEQVKNKKKWTSSFQKWPTLGRVKVEVPQVELKTPKLLLLAEENEEQDPPRIGVAPQPPSTSNFSLDNYSIRRLLQKNLPDANINGDSECPSSLTNIQKELLSIMTNYSDIYYPEATHEHWEEVRTVYALHTLNHVLKTRKRVVKHSAKIRRLKAEKKFEASETNRDQGYARPTVLILLPFKHSAYRFVETLVTLMFGDSPPNVVNLKRFREDFGPGETEKEEKQFKLSRAEDFNAIFTGDINEDFKIGLKISKNSIQLYADFYQSDIILASPLGLRYIMSTNSRTDAENDFLSSIEILVIDQADIFLMQNWEHVLVVSESVGQAPRDLQKLGSDITRVRLWALEGMTPLYRQTLVFASTLSDQNRAIMAKCTNFAGRLQVLNPVENGSVGEVVVEAEMVVMRIPGHHDYDARFHHFTREVLPRLRSGPPCPGTMLYIPDYCDYLRILRHLKEDGGMSVATINEYMVGQNSKVAKARSLFFDGKRHLLLYTERFHFYRRYRIKGVRHVIFYDLPTYPHFFPEICNLMVDGNQNRRLADGGVGGRSVYAMVQQKDLTKLIGVLGSTHAAQLINATKPVHVCVLGR